jgi:hypothetical protein
VNAIPVYLSFSGGLDVVVLYPVGQLSVCRWVSVWPLCIACQPSYLERGRDGSGSGFNSNLQWCAFAEWSILSFHCSHQSRMCPLFFFICPLTCRGSHVTGVS